MDGTEVLLPEYRLIKRLVKLIEPETELIFLKTRTFTKQPSKDSQVKMLKKFLRLKQEEGSDKAQAEESGHLEDPAQEIEDPADADMFEDHADADVDEDLADAAEVEEPEVNK